MNVFFELADGVMCEEGKYFAAYGVRKSAAIAGKYRVLMWNSTRAWAEEEDGNVRFLKHRYSDVSASVTPVDLKEFFWIKLKSKAL